VKST
jgi:hypothetical protein